MPAPTPAYVKNMIRRSLREVIDPSPMKKDEHKVWEFFNSECAYCGKQLRKAHKEGHIDHLIPASQGGSNQLSNRVLSCASCNEKEKLDMHWEVFLKRKNQNADITSARKERIVRWQRMHYERFVDKKVLARIGTLGNEVVSVYERNVESARRLRR